MIEDRLASIIAMSNLLLSLRETLEKETERIMEDNLEEAYFLIKDCVILLLAKNEEQREELGLKPWSELEDEVKALTCLPTA